MPGTRGGTEQGLMDLVEADLWCKVVRSERMFAVRLLLETGDSRLTDIVIQTPRNHNTCLPIPKQIRNERFTLRLKSATTGKACSSAAGCTVKRSRIRVSSV